MPYYKLHGSKYHPDTLGSMQHEGFVLDHDIVNVVTMEIIKSLIWPLKSVKKKDYMDGLVQDCSNSIANPLELLHCSLVQSHWYDVWDYWTNVQAMVLHVFSLLTLLQLSTVTTNHVKSFGLCFSTFMICGSVHNVIGYMWDNAFQNWL